MKKNKTPFYITTPIYYPSAKLHIGHAYCTTLADTIARYKRLGGYDVFFLTGSDEHGQKIQTAAEAAGVKPIEYVDGIVAGFQSLWRRLNISNDDFLRTSQKRHEKVVQEIFRRIYDKGDIYKGSYKGLYCTPCESYWTEHQLDENGCCPDCHRPVHEVEEEAYFFKMSKYADAILRHIEKHPDFIQPTSRRNEMVNFIKQGLEDLCISRTSFDWGIQVPLDPKHVIYVWFDALSNYLTPIGYLDDKVMFDHFWPADMHLVGKEIVRFHSIIWPCILLALGEKLPRRIYGHGWLVVDGDKMSKSKGNVVDPNLLIDEFGPDAIRYFLLREINLGQDGNFSRDALIKRINSDLANDLGNLLHRTLNMLGQFQGGVIDPPDYIDHVDQSLIDLAESTVHEYRVLMDDFRLSEALKLVWNFVGRANKYIDQTRPWSLAKDPKMKKPLATVLYNLAESLRLIAVMIAPFLPDTAPRIWKQLGLEEIKKFADLRFLDIDKWGGLPAGLKTGEAVQLFPRIDVKAEAARQAAAAEAEKKAAKAEKEAAKAKAKAAAPQADVKGSPETADGVIGIDDFQKVQLRVAEITAAAPVPKADKLLQLTLNLGEGVEPRTVVSGIAPKYSCAELIGKHIILVANLKPAKLRGVVSQGMVLAATDADGQPVLIESGSPVGSVVR